MADGYDPLSVIPSVGVIEQRLMDAEQRTRKLRVLLKTAKAIEKAGRTQATNPARGKPHRNTSRQSGGK